jgi:hypothetical protein
MKNLNDCKRENEERYTTSNHDFFNGRGFTHEKTRTDAVFPAKKTKRVRERKERGSR